MPAGVTNAIAGGAAARRADHRGSKPQRRVRGRARRPRVRHRSRAVRQRPRPPAEGDAPGGAPGHPRAADRRATSSSTSITASPGTSGCCGAAAAPATSATSSELAFQGQDRIFVPVEQIGRISRYSGGEDPTPLEARWHGLAAHEAARPEGRRRPGRGAAGAVRGARLGAGPRLPGGHAVAGRDGGRVPVRGDGRPAARGQRGQARHGGGPADGPAGRRRRRLRQDRGGHPGGVQGDAGRQAGRGARPDDRARGAALRHVRRPLRAVPGQGRAALAIRAQVGAGEGRRGSRRRLRRPRHRYAPPAVA